MSVNPLSDPLVAILGATGTGKSKLAVELAQRFNGEIINGDAMQMYKGLPIITNKITEAERQNIPHHIFDQIGLDEQPWTVSNFRRQTQKVIREIRSRGKLPILVGGTHYYAKAVLFDDYFLDHEEGFADGEEGDSQPEFPILDAPTSIILAKLREVDPNMASRWHPADRRKIQRSLEIWLRTGKTASQNYETQSQQRLERRRNESDLPDERTTAHSSLIFWLKTEDNILKQRLDDRIDSMLASGLIEEAQAIAAYERDLTTAGITLNKTKGIWASIGYKEMEPYISALNNPSSNSNASQLSNLKTTSITSTKSATRRYARSQDRWIRIHFSRALLEANALDTLYPLDTTSPEHWTTDVLEPATEITSQFLTSQTLPAPESISDMARETLAGIRAELQEQDNNDNTSSGGSKGRECRYCSICDKTLMTEKEWMGHVKGNGHKKAVAGRKKWEDFQAWKARHQVEQEKGRGEDAAS